MRWPCIAEPGRRFGMSMAGIVHLHWQSLNREARGGHGAGARRVSRHRANFRVMRRNPGTLSIRRHRHSPFPECAGLRDRYNHSSAEPSRLAAGVVER